MRTNPEIVEALKELHEKKGILHPKDVVEEARKESSPLHSQFEWDDTEAAEKYRVWQARELITTVYVKVESNGKPRNQQVFVSLSSDREKGGGYRALVDVLSTKAGRNQLIRDALSDMQHFTQRYETMRELAQVRNEMNKATKVLSSKTR